MKILIIISISLYAYASVSEESCTGAYYNNICHEIELITNNLTYPISLIVDFYRNDLYFSQESHMERSRWRTTCKINLDTRTLDTILPVPIGVSQIIDRYKGDIYIGGCSGIYKIPGQKDKIDNGDKIMNLNSITLVALIKDSCIQSIFYHKGILYYVDYPLMTAYVVGNKGSYRRLKDLEGTIVYKLLIDDNNFMFYSNDTGLYKQKLGTTPEASVSIPAEYYDSASINCLSLDAKGDIYACLREGIFKVNQKSLKLEPVLRIYEPYGVAFNKNNRLIFSTNSSIYILNPITYTNAHEEAHNTLSTLSNSTTELANVDDIKDILRDVRESRLLKILTNYADETKDLIKPSTALVQGILEQLSEPSTALEQVNDVQKMLSYGEGESILRKLKSRHQTKHQPPSGQWGSGKVNKTRETLSYEGKTVDEINPSEVMRKKDYNPYKIT